MDWTGGVRRRFAAGRNNALLQKQKAHFAKARAAHTPGSQKAPRSDFAHEPRGAHIASASSQRRQDQIIRRERRKSHLLSLGEDGDHHTSGTTSEQRFVSAIRDPRTRQSPSVITISSGSQSTAVSPTSIVVKPIASQQHHSASRQPIRMTAEEELLLANRKRLLARTDWLGLAAARPVHMRFPSSSDRDRIGKRRKVDKSARKGEPAQRRLLTPLFEERLHPPDFLMSGALPADDIRIKIGTDALASQTQRSRHTQTLANVSERPISSEFGSLSEESMLLGDDDTFGVAKPLELTTANEAIDGKGFVSITRIASGQSTTGVQRIPRSPEMRLLSDQATGVGTSYGRRLPSPDGDVVVQEGYIAARRSTSASYASIDADAERQDADTATPPGMVGVDDTPSSAYNDANEDEDDSIWKRLMNINQHTSDHASIAALRSSSRHITTSESSHRPALAGEVEKEVVEGQSISTPIGAGTQGEPFPYSTKLSAKQQGNSASPSASLKQIVRLAEQPANSGKISVKDSDENALWRQFIIGSDDGSSNGSHDVDMARSVGDDPSSRPADPSSLSVSGLGTSDKATIGETLFVSHSAQSATPEDRNIVC